MKQVEEVLRIEEQKCENDITEQVHEVSPIQVLPPGAAGPVENVEFDSPVNPEDQVVEFQEIE